AGDESLLTCAAVSNGNCQSDKPADHRLQGPLLRKALRSLRCPHLPDCWTPASKKAINPAFCALSGVHGLVDPWSAAGPLPYCPPINCSARFAISSANGMLRKRTT